MPLEFDELGNVKSNAHHIQDMPTFSRRQLLGGRVSLTAEQVRLIRESYAWIVASPHSYSQLFYHRLVLEHPFARALFPDGITHQIIVFAKKLTP